MPQNLSSLCPLLSSMTDLHLKLLLWQNKTTLIPNLYNFYVTNYPKCQLFQYSKLQYRVNGAGWA